MWLKQSSSASLRQSGPLGPQLQQPLCSYAAEYGKNTFLIVFAQAGHSSVFISLDTLISNKFKFLQPLAFGRWGISLKATFLYFSENHEVPILLLYYL